MGRLLMMPLTNTISYSEAYQQGLAKKGSKGQEVAKAEVVIPANFLCPICEEMMTDAVKTPCCGTNYCDKCELTAIPLLYSIAFHRRISTSGHVL